ncbi:MAG TPA: alpha/beta fold hydrolase [Spirochaetia bacterium]|nr:alpha/beta fold hydrolase [Spirochaetia bacterium]
MLKHITAGIAQGPTIVLCHGFGANMHDLVPIATELGDDRYRFVFPQAPTEIPGYPGGYAWFPREERELSMFATGAAFSDLSGFDPPGLSESARDVAVLLDHLEADPGRTIVAGFSQGAMIACEMLFGGHWGRPVGLLVLSGSLIAGERWTKAGGSAAELPVLQSHGDADPILPIGQAERLGELFGAARADHRFLRFAGGHAVPQPVIHSARSFIRKTLG